MSMLGKKEAATRQRSEASIEARPLVERGDTRTEQRRRPSGMRMRAAVIVDRQTDDRDPYADVPCTD